MAESIDHAPNPKRGKGPFRRVTEIIRTLTARASLLEASLSSFRRQERRRFVDLQAMIRVAPTTGDPTHAAPVQLLHPALFDPRGTPQVRNYLLRFSIL